MRISILFLIAFALAACTDTNDEYEVYELYSPILMTMDEVRAGVRVEESQEITQTGKIYYKHPYLFVNELNKGIHIIDNSNATNPQKKAFIRIPGNVDMEMLGNYLYVDSYTDLLVFDLTNIFQIKVLHRSPNAFPNYVNYPEIETDLPYQYNFEGFDPQNTIVVGWNSSKELRKKQENIMIDGVFESSDFVKSNTTSTTGQGGSLARFKIADNHLYAIDRSQLHVYSLEVPQKPEKKSNTYITWMAETLFYSKEHLFVGSRDGVYIYALEDPENPIYVSQFTHATMCDPVVVQDDFAYVTLRAENFCAAANQQSRLEIINISNIDNPYFHTSYNLENPFGLGIKDNLLMVCEGEFGLKVFDKKNLKSLSLLQHEKSITAFDVIPLESHLIVIGNRVVYQYDYLENGLSLISSFNL